MGPPQRHTGLGLHGDRGDCELDDSREATVGSTDELGVIEGKEPIPPDPEKTTYIDVGVLSIGVEYREVDAESIFEYVEDLRLNYPDKYAELGLDSREPTIIEDVGVSLHVCYQPTRVEYLRFDCFQHNPHYHYITPGYSNRVVAFDTNAHGPLLPWTLGLLRDKERLSEMLRYAGAADLADELADGGADMGDIAARLGKLEQKIEEVMQ